MELLRTPLRAIALPRRELAPFVRNLMVSSFPTLDVHLPASPDPQLVVYLRGGAMLKREDGRLEPLPTVFAVGPSLIPRRFRVAPGSRFVAAVFKPSGFLHCMGIPVNSLGPGLVPLDAVLAPGELLPLLDRLHRARRVRELIEALEAFLLQKRRRCERDPPFLPPLAVQQLLLPTRELAATLDLSTRQFERRFLAHHGVPLRDYRRLARFSMVLALLMRGQPSLASAALDAGYVDQPHFNRDFREFVGDTPASFVKNRFEEDTGYRFWQFDSEELRAFFG